MNFISLRNVPGEKVGKGTFPWEFTWFPHHTLCTNQTYRKHFPFPEANQSNYWNAWL